MRAPKQNLRADPNRQTRRATRERVLVEFPAPLLERADRAAAVLAKNRSELIRTAVEHLLDGIDRKKFEAELAEAYAENADRNLKLADEFAAVDNEGFR